MMNVAVMAGNANSFLAMLCIGILFEAVSYTHLVEVLSYIERIAAANAEKARALEDTIAALQKDLTGVRRQGSPLEMCIRDRRWSGARL